MVETFRRMYTYCIRLPLLKTANMVLGCVCVYISLDPVCYLRTEPVQRIASIL
jgi:hypothetical protein